MKRLLALTWKEFLQLKRDRITMRMIVFVPIMQTLIFGYAINYDVKHLKTVVYDEARSVESRDVVSKMTATEYFTVVGHVSSFEELRHALDSARASVGLVIDRDFGKERPPGIARPRVPDRQRLGHDDGDPGHVDRVGHRQRAVGAPARAEGRRGSGATLPSTCGCGPGTTPT